jgi:ubiquinol-cytochrome c reductase cytochrome b subunit
MNEQEKQQYLEEYKKEKEKGVYFFPDIIFKDAVIALVVFLILVAMAYFIGAPLEEQANPSDSTYNPRPEWYFLFLFQLLKYFPGELEVVGVVVIPSLAILVLLALPFLDKKADRHFTKRKAVTIGTAIGIVGIIGLTILSIREAPPPADTSLGDKTAELYAVNCAGCHGPTINVPTGMNLHEIIAQGTHEGMPPWSADLTNDQIDALVGFILSPGGSVIFDQQCGECHLATQLIADQPFELKDALQLGQAFGPHTDIEIPQWTTILSPEEQTALLNFLIAPDGQRLFVTNCSSCHGSSVAFAGEAEELRETIGQGGLHLEMPGWREQLSEAELTSLASYVVDPAQSPDGESLYQANCVACHFERVPQAEDLDSAFKIISEGGSHETMPVWGEILTEEQIDALVSYTIQSAQGTGADVGRQLYVQNCASCHGDFGEGGANPSLAGDIIAPISTAEYLKTRDDSTLTAIIAQGQPNFGMSPFGLSFGGPLDESEIEALVAYMRSWESNPPVDVPPEISTDTLALSGAETYQALCAQCHGSTAEGGLGPSLRSAEFREQAREEIFSTINLGHEATAMIAWGEVLSASQIDQIVEFLLSLPVSEGSAAGEVSFAVQIVPAFDTYCLACHNESFTQGGWLSDSYENVINSGDNGPSVIPGDVENSLLAQLLVGTAPSGKVMPPVSQMPDEIIQAILDWIEAGAPNN